MDAEERIKNDLAVLNMRRQKMFDKRDVLLAQEASYGHYIEETLAQGNSAKVLQTFDSGKQYYREKKVQLNQNIARIEKDIVQTQAKLSEAMQARKIMEKLKEKAYNQYMDAYNKADIKLIEEIINYSGNQMNGERNG
jgi:flagellar FliJ protein